MKWCSEAGELSRVAVDPVDEEAEQFGEFHRVAEVQAYLRHLVSSVPWFRRAG